MVKCTIRVYLFPDVLQYVTNSQPSTSVIQEIEQSTHTTIQYISKQYDSYLEIEGPFEMSHQARIMLQDVEKEIYRSCYKS